MRTLFEKYHPDHFGKVGMRWYHWKKNAEFARTIEIDKLWTLFKDDDREKLVKNPDVPVIDLRNYGYDKVLGIGDLQINKPIVVIARQFTPNAEKKINAVGGKCICAA